MLSISIILHVNLARLKITAVNIRVNRMYFLFFVLYENLDVW